MFFHGFYIFQSTEILPNIRQSLINSIDRRFSDILSSGFSDESDPIFLAAAFFDPIVAPKLPTSELGSKARIAAKKLVLFLEYVFNFLMFL